MNSDTYRMIFGLIDVSIEEVERDGTISVLMEMMPDQAGRLQNSRPQNRIVQGILTNVFRAYMDHSVMSPAQERSFRRILVEMIEGVPIALSPLAMIDDEQMQQRQEMREEMREMLTNDVQESDGGSLGGAIDEVLQKLTAQFLGDNEVTIDPTTGDQWEDDVDGEEGHGEEGDNPHSEDGEEAPPT